MCMGKPGKWSAALAWVGICYRETCLERPLVLLPHVQSEPSIRDDPPWTSWSWKIIFVGHGTCGMVSQESFCCRLYGYIISTFTMFTAIWCSEWVKYALPFTLLFSLNNHNAIRNCLITLASYVWYGQDSTLSQVYQNDSIHALG